MVKRKVDAIKDKVQDDLKQIDLGHEDKVDEKSRSEYKKRKLLQETIIKSYLLSKGSEFSLSIEKAETELTPEMIASGAWKTANFKPYNFDAMGIQPHAGHLHPLLKVKI
jgi:phenylalanyl-tRNA synthetase alpha chain